MRPETRPMDPGFTFVCQTIGCLQLVMRPETRFMDPGFTLSQAWPEPTASRRETKKTSPRLKKKKTNPIRPCSVIYIFLGGLFSYIRWKGIPLLGEGINQTRPYVSMDLWCNVTQYCKQKMATETMNDDRFFFKKKKNEQLSYQPYKNFGSTNFCAHVHSKLR